LRELLEWVKGNFDKADNFEIGVDRLTEQELFGDQEGSAVLPNPLPSSNFQSRSLGRLGEPSNH